MFKFTCTAVGLICVGLIQMMSVNAFAENLRLQIDGDWWSVASNPDPGKYTSDKPEPVGFGIWQAADGTWQIWSCIRNTRCGGHTRLFFRRESKHLTDTIGRRKAWP